MENTQTLLQGSSDMEKGAYLGAIASIATADRQASPEEVDYLSSLADSAGLSADQKEAVINAAHDISGDDVLRCLDVVKKSDLKFSLVTDVIAFAKSDNNYSEEEQKNVQKMAEYLGVSQQQFSLLDHFTDKVKDSTSENATSSEVSENAASSAVSADEGGSTDLLSSLGLKDKLQSAGINGSSIFKGILGMAAPMILAKMFTGGLNRNRGGGGLFSGGGGGMFGGGGGGMFGGGGLGSIFSMFTGGSSFGSSGGLLSRVLRGGF